VTPARFGASPQINVFRQVRYSLSLRPLPALSSLSRRSPVPYNPLTPGCDASRRHAPLPCKAIWKARCAAAWIRSFFDLIFPKEEFFFVRSPSRTSPWLFAIRSSCSALFKVNRLSPRQIDCPFLSLLVSPFVLFFSGSQTEPPDPPIPHV